jgi:hypothetical protein
MELRSHSSVSCHLVAIHGTPCQTKQTLLKYILDYVYIKRSTSVDDAFQSINLETV